MAQDFSRHFYNTRAWKKTREAYGKSRGFLCEICLAKGIYKPNAIVHHKVELTPANINDPRITLGWDNLQCVCRECHADIHGIYEKNEEKPLTPKTDRYTVDESGRVITL